MIHLAQRHFQHFLKSFSFLMLAVFIIQAQPIYPSFAFAKKDSSQKSLGVPTPEHDKTTVQSLPLNEAETNWLKAHPEITIAINQAWPPMDYVDTEGEPRGIGVGFIGAINARLGGRLKIVPLPWEEMVEKVKQKKSML